MELYIKFAGDIPLAKASGDSPPKPKAKEDITYKPELIPAAFLRKAAGIKFAQQFMFILFHELRAHLK